MCLSIIDKRPKANSFGIGFKVMRTCTSPNEVTCSIIPQHRNKPFKIGTGIWYRAKLVKKAVLYVSYGEIGHYLQYRTGFHLYATKEDAYNYCNVSPRVVVQCEYRGLLATGSQNGVKVLVADEIRLVQICPKRRKGK